MYITMTSISKRQRAHFYMYKKKKQLRNVYIYLKKSRYFEKSKAICVTFLFTKIQTHYVTRFFVKLLKLEFLYIQKSRHFALQDVFIYKNPDTSKKSRQFALFFLIQNPDTLLYAIFMEFLKQAEGGEEGGIFINKKPCTLG